VNRVEDEKRGQSLGASAGSHGHLPGSCPPVRATAKGNFQTAKELVKRDLVRLSAVKPYLKKKMIFNIHSNQRT